MSNKQIEDLVDLMFDTDMEEVMKEKSTLEYIHKLQQENKQLKEDKKKAIEYIKDKLYSLNMNKSAIMRIVEPSNGHLLADVNYEIQKWEKLLEILGDKE